MFVDGEPSSRFPRKDDALPFVIDGGRPSGADSSRDAVGDDGGVTEDAHADVIGDNVCELDTLTLPS